MPRLWLDSEGRVVRLEEETAALLGIEPAEAIGRPCPEMVQGQDPFGRPVCRRCPIQHALKRGAHWAYTRLLVGKRRMRCEGYGGKEWEIHLTPERSFEPSHLLQALARAARFLIQTPEKFLEVGEAFLRQLREALGMDAAELFLAEPKGHHLVLTLYDGPHPKAFMERPLFKLGEGYPGLVAQGRTPLVTHDLPQDQRYLRESVKRLGYHTYISYPLELPHGLIGVLNLASRDRHTDDQRALEALGAVAPFLATTLYTVLTRLSEAGLEKAASALSRGEETEALKVLLDYTRRLTKATGIRVVDRKGQSYTLGWTPACAMKNCPAWEGRIVGYKNGLPPCPEAEGRARTCLPLWVGGQVIGVETLFHAHPPRPTTQSATPTLWLQRLVLPLALGKETGPELEIYTLGTFKVLWKGKELRPQDFGRTKAWALLKLFLVHRNRPLYVEDIAEALFPGKEPDKARQEVYTLVYHLRKTLPGLVEREGEYYRLTLPASSFLDVERFESLLDQAEREEGLAAFHTLREASTLYKGPFLGDDPYGDWGEMEKIYLENRAVTGLLRLGELARALGYTQAALEAYLKILRLDPTHPEALKAVKEIQPHSKWIHTISSNDYGF